jgi:hypothetical protein
VKTTLVRAAEQEQPSIALNSGEAMNPIPQILEDLAFEREDLQVGCQEGIYEGVSTGEAERIRSTGSMISSSFVVWQDGPEGRKVCFEVKPSKQSKNWPKGKRDNEGTAQVRFRIRTRGRWCHSTSKRDTDTFGWLRK